MKRTTALLLGLHGVGVPSSATAAELTQLQLWCASMGVGQEDAEGLPYNQQAVTLCVKHVPA